MRGSALETAAADGTGEGSERLIELLSAHAARELGARLRQELIVVGTNFRSAAGAAIGGVRLRIHGTELERSHRRTPGQQQRTRADADKSARGEKSAARYATRHETTPGSGPGHRGHHRK